MATRQERVELKGSARAALPGAHDVGPVDPNQQIEVTVVLRRGSSPDKFPRAIEMELARLASESTLPAKNLHVFTVRLPRISKKFAPLPRNMV